MSEQGLVWFIGFGAIILVGLVLAVLLGVGRIGLAIFRDWREQRKPKKSVVMAGLGKLTFDARGLLWFGEVDGVSITIGGDADGPDGRLLEAYREIRRKMPGLQSEALKFLMEGEDAKSLDAKVGDFSLCGISLLWTGKVECFKLEFSLNGDLDGVWRVEFQGDKPVFCGRDD
jgi:hypothetical protein